ncbi:MAG: hypothetical protein JNM74_27590, partial [Myxococcales bacterium]|nr:hypothetical protein [Myxococcales bacterium]
MFRTLGLAALLSVTLFAACTREKIIVVQAPPTTGATGSAMPLATNDGPKPEPGEW